MARSDRKVTAIIEARDNTARAFKSVQRNLSGLQNAVAGIGAAVGIAFGTREAIQAIGRFAKAAGVQEDATAALAQSIRNAGGSVKEFLPLIQAQADALQATTRFGDEEIERQAALLLAYGATSENIGKLTRASIQYASGAGKSLEEAFRQVGKSLGGTAGELTDAGSEFGNLTREQLQAGAAADILLEKFDGVAEALAGTFAGALQQTQNAVGDLEESLGRGLAEVFRVGLVDAIKPAVESLTRFLDNTKLLDSAVKGTAITLLNLAKVVVVGADQIARFDLQLRSVATVLNFVTGEGTKFAAIIDQLTSGLQAQSTVGALALARLEEMKKALREVTNETERAVDDVTEFGGKMEVTFVRAKDAVASFADGGIPALAERVLAANTAIEGIGATIGRTFRTQGVSAAQQFGTTLVDAAFGAKVNFEEFFRQLLQQLAVAIAQALILRAVLSATGFGAGAGGALSGALGAGPVGAIGGAIGLGVGGGPIRDTPIDRDTLSDIALGGAATPVVEVSITGRSVAALVEEINVETRQRRVRPLAAQLVDTRSV